MLNDKTLILPIILGMTPKSPSNVEVGGIGKDGWEFVFDPSIFYTCLSVKIFKIFLKYLLAIQCPFE